MFVSYEPTILHADLDAFFASVEQRDDPSLRDRPVIVGGGVVLAASYEARAFGVRTAMGGAPSAGAVSRGRRRDAADERLQRREQGGLRGLCGHRAAGRGVIDRRGVPRRPRPRAHLRYTERVARKLRAAVRDQVGLPITVGIASTKFLAKVAQRRGQTRRAAARPARRRARVPASARGRALWGVGAVTAAKLHAAGITTVGQVAALERGGTRADAGPGVGTAAPCTCAQPGSASGPPPAAAALDRRPRALGRRHTTIAEQNAALLALVDRVTRRLRASRRVCRTVVLRLRFDDFSRATRSLTMRSATDRTQTILAAAREPADDDAAVDRRARADARRRGAHQPARRHADAARAADRAGPGTRRNARPCQGPLRYAAITRGALVGRREDPTVPLLED